MDLVFLGGNVMTMDRGGTRAEALAVKDGKIAAVGATAEVSGMVSEGTEVVPLAGRTLIPGFVDPHNHFSATVFDPVAVDCWTPPHGSITGIKDAIARAAGAALPGQWIFGWGFAGDYVREGRNLTSRDLDDAAPDNPVCIMDGSHHSCYANSLAMQLGGIDSSTPDPRGGQILKDSQGEPSGELWERAMDPVHSLCLKDHVDRHGEGAGEFVYRNSMKHLSVGITSVGEALVTPDAARLYKMADEQGKIPIALRQQLGGLTFFRAPEEASRGELGIEDTSDRLRGGTLKMFMDPVFPDAANFKCHDNGEIERVGTQYYSQEEADELVLSAHKLGMQVIIHCLGPWAIEQALNSFERALREKPVSDPRFRIEHFTMPTREQIDKAKSLDVIASVQPPFIYTWADRQQVRARELGRTFGIEAYRSMIDAGLTVAAGSDNPCAPLDPLIGIRAAVNRVARRTGEPVSPEEAVTPMEALQMYTMNSAVALRRESEVGSVEVGKRADLVVLGHDPTQANPDFITDIAVERTYVDGQCLYSRY